MNLLTSEIMKLNSIESNYGAFTWLLSIKCLNELTPAIGDIIIKKYGLVINNDKDILIFKIDKLAKTRQLIGMRHYSGFYDMDMNEIDQFIRAILEHFDSSSFEDDNIGLAIA